MLLYKKDQKELASIHTNAFYSVPLAFAFFLDLSLWGMGVVSRGDRKLLGPKQGE
jgi:hypothetical protein